MPELPEVETVRRTLLPRFVGRCVTSAALYRRDVCLSWEVGVRGLRSVRTCARNLLEGATIAEIQRHGKQLAIVAQDGRSVCVHLGMSGSLTWTDEVTLPPHTHVEWITPVGRVRFTDPRRFGGLWTYPSLGDLRTHRWAALGPDALTISVAQFAEAVRTARRPIKSLLLDQSRIAGVGNIYADEALFMANLHPLRVASSLKDGQVELLHGAVQTILTNAVEARGSSIRSYRDGEGKPGSYQGSHAVYGRSGLPCNVCETPLMSRVIGGRTTTWCPVCQAK